MLNAKFLTKYIMVHYYSNQKPHQKSKVYIFIYNTKLTKHLFSQNVFSKWTFLQEGIN